MLAATLPPCGSVDTDGAAFSGMAVAIDSRAPQAHIAAMPASAKSKSAAAKTTPKADPAAADPAARPVKKGDHVFLVDGSGYIFRAYHAIRFEPRTPEGVH